MIPSLVPNLGLGDVRAWLSVWENPENTYPTRMSQAFGTPFALTTSSARAALFHILKANGIVGKDVLITAYTCSVVTEAIVQSGNRPVLVDTAANSFNAEITDRHVAQHRPNLGAVILTNIFGTTEFSTPPIARGQGFLLILDAALSPSHVATAPSEAFDYVYTSGGVRKPLTSLGGGLILTSHEQHFCTLAGHLRRTLRVRPCGNRMKGWAMAPVFFTVFKPGFYDLASMLRRKTHFLDRFFSERSNDIHAQNPEFQHDMHDYQKRVGALQLDHLAVTAQWRREISNRYQELLEASYPDAAKFWRADVPYSHFPFLHPRRDALERHLLERGIDVERYFDYAISDIEQYGFVGEFERAQHLARQMLNLPIHKQLSDADIVRVVTEIKRFDGLAG